MADKKKKKNRALVPTTYVNRELSWMAFNNRVLLEAVDPEVPLLERLKFLMIYQSNLEEYYRVRIGILTHRALLTPQSKDPVSKMLPQEQIQAVLKETHRQQDMAYNIWKEIKKQLRPYGIEVLSFKKISKVDELMCKKLFADIKGLLHPQIINVDKSLPFLWDQECYVLAFSGQTNVEYIAVVPLNRVPAYLSFEINGCTKIVLTDQLVLHFLPLLLKKENILQSAVVKVTRNADVLLTNAGKDEDFRRKTASMLSRRKRETPVRIQIQGKLSEKARGILIKKLRLPKDRIFTPRLPFNLSFQSAVKNRELFFDERKSSRDIGLKKGEYFSYLKNHDLLLSFPFQSMLPFLDLIYEAVDDPEVLSIKITLYRMSASSKIAAALAYAADRGKDVLCLLELRARFDEQNNIDYSEMLEDAGCRVIYGLPDMKVHSKLFVITRRHEGHISYITQVGTGNYNEVTGEQYTDLSLITADETVGKEAEAVFDALVHGQVPPEVSALWIAPLTFKNRVLEMLDLEIAKGREGRVVIKVNSLNSPAIMEKLIQCSKAGVQVELFIRGICCLRPGIPGETDNITVKSIVGRYLEHSRIFSFGGGEDQRLFIGSGDLLNRNLERRVEAFIEVKTPETRAQVNQILTALHQDKEKGWVMQPDGSYIKEKDGKGSSSQEILYQYFCSTKLRPDSEE